VGFIFNRCGAPRWAASKACRQVTAHLNKHYENYWIGRHGPVSWPPRSPDLTTFDFCLWGLMKEMTYRTNLNTRRELLHRTVAAAACKRELTEMIRLEVNSCLERASLSFENFVGHFIRFKMYLI
jgi:hypothetical protein